MSSKNYNVPIGVAVAISTNRRELLSQSLPLSEEHQRELLDLIGDLLEDRQRLLEECLDLKNRAYQTRKVIESFEAQCEKMTQAAQGVQDECSNGSDQ